MCDKTNRLSARCTMLLVAAVLLAAVSTAACTSGQEATALDLTGNRVAVLIAMGFEPTETKRPIEYLSERGAEVVVVSYGAGPVTGGDGRDVTAELGIADVVVEDFDCLIIPGGESPTYLRTNEKALELVREFVRQDKLVAALCAGPQVLISARVVEGRKLTGSGITMAEVNEADGLWDGGNVVRDGNIITGRGLAETLLFAKEIAKALAGL